MIPVALYLRMSDAKQETSLADQRAACRRYAKGRFVIVAEYVDEGISGDATEKRAGFQRMLADARTGRFSGILCWDQDRFGRFDAVEAGFWVKPLRDAGVWLETVNQGRIDWDDFAGRVIFSIQQEAKHGYLRDLSRNVNRGMLSAAQQGRMLGAPPRGYALEDQRPVVTADAEVIREIFALYLAGLSCREVATELNRRGVRPLKAALWTRTTIYQALTNEFYVGVYVWGARSEGKYSEVCGGAVVPVRAGSPKLRPKDEPVRIEGHHEPIIDRDIFDRVQALLALNRRHTAPRRAEAFALSGLLRCGACGAAMHGRHRGRSRARYYVCSTALHSAGCRSNAALESDLVGLVAVAIQQQFGSAMKRREFAESIRRRLGKPAAGEDLERRLAAVRQKLERAKVRLVECEDDLLKAMKDQVRRLAAEESELLSRIGECKSIREQARNLESQVSDAVATATADLERAAARPAEYRRIISRLVRQATVYVETDPAHRSRFVISRLKIAFRVGAVLLVAASLDEQVCVSVARRTA